jgi:hypothetical protein
MSKEEHANDYRQDNRHQLKLYAGRGSNSTGSLAIFTAIRVSSRCE